MASLDDQVPSVSAGPEVPKPGEWSVEAEIYCIGIYINWILPALVLEADITNQNRSDERMIQTEVYP